MRPCNGYRRHCRPAFLSLALWTRMRTRQASPSPFPETTIRTRRSAFTCASSRLPSLQARLVGSLLVLFPAPPDSVPSLRPHPSKPLPPHVLPRLSSRPPHPVYPTHMSEKVGCYDGPVTKELGAHGVYRNAATITPVLTVPSSTLESPGQRRTSC